MRKVANKEFAEYKTFMEDVQKGYALTPDHIRSICNGCGNNPEKIGNAILEINGKIAERKAKK